MENSLRDATALRRGGSRSRLHKSWKILSGMPRPCAVEVHARGYTKAGEFSPGCHGLAPWRFMLAATQKLENSLRDVTALRRGGSCSRLHKSWRTLSGCHGLAPWRFTLAATQNTSDLAGGTALGGQVPTVER